MKKARIWILVCLLGLLLLSQLPSLLSSLYRLSPRVNPMAQFAPIAATFTLYEYDADRGCRPRNVSLPPEDMSSFVALFADSQRDPWTPKMACILQGAVTNSAGRGESLSIYERRGMEVSFCLGDAYYCAGQDNLLSLFAERISRGNNDTSEGARQPADWSPKPSM